MHIFKAMLGGMSAPVLNLSEGVLDSSHILLCIYSPNTILSNGPPVDASAQIFKKGYILNGRWDFSSGFPHSTWLVALAPVIDPLNISNDNKEMRNLFLRKKDIEVIDVWDVNGLRGTGSFSFVANELYVDQDKTFIDGEPPIQSGSLYLIPKPLLFASGFATVALGVARSSLDYAIKLSNEKKPHAQKMLCLPYFDFQMFWNI